MEYDFNRTIDRKKTGSVKWELVEELFGEKNLLPMWVADMDFDAPAPVVEALINRAKHGIYGYTACMPSFYKSIIDWNKKRYNIDIDREWILFSPGVVPALNMIIQAFTRSGDKVIIQLPVYYPFIKAVENNECSILSNSLILEDGRYRINFADLEQKAKDNKAKLLILCSPHNPVGRVWTEEELVRIGEICNKNEVLVISDEIHSDLILKGFKHTPFASISTDSLMNSITCNSPSKSFNLAGLQTSYIVIADPVKRQKFSKVLARNGITGPNVFGALALEAAYSYGEEWLKQLIEYIQKNLEFLKDFIHDRIPMVRVIEPEATYLVWLDFRKLGLDKKGLKNFIRKEAGLALDDGYMLGSAEGDGFERINIACNRSTLERGLSRLEKAIKNL